MLLLFIGFVVVFSLIIIISFAFLMGRGLRPKTAASKIVVVVGSLIFGLFILFLLGGAFGFWSSIITDFTGFIISLVVSIIGYVIFSIILSAMVKSIDSGVKDSKKPVPIKIGNVTYYAKAKEKKVIKS